MLGLASPPESAAADTHAHHGPVIIARTDQALVLLASSSLFLGLLLFWHYTHALGCWSLVSPGLVCLTIAYGLLEYRLERKRFTVEYVLDRRSHLRSWLRRQWMVVLLSGLVALPLGVALLIFSALSQPSDWLFLAAGTLLGPFLFLGLLSFPGEHLRRGTSMGRSGLGIREIITARIAGWILIALLAGAYIYFNYGVIEQRLGERIFPGYPQLTAEAFRAAVQSACPIVESGLRFAALIEGILWHFMTQAVDVTWLPEGIRLLLWCVFFLNISIAFTGFVRGIEGCILMAWKLYAGTDAE